MPNTRAVASGQPVHGNPINEYLQFYELGVDGVFSADPDHAVTARELFWEDWFRED